MPKAHKPALFASSETPERLALIHQTSRHAIANSLLTRLGVAQMIMSLIHRSNTSDGTRRRYIESVKRILESTEAELVNVSLRPSDFASIHAEVDRLQFQIAVQSALPNSLTLDHR